MLANSFDCEDIARNSPLKKGVRGLFPHKVINHTGPAIRAIGSPIYNPLTPFFKGESEFANSINIYPPLQGL